MQLFSISITLHISYSFLLRAKQKSFTLPTHISHTNLINDNTSCIIHNNLIAKLLQRDSFTFTKNRLMQKPEPLQTELCLAYPSRTNTANFACQSCPISPFCEWLMLLVVSKRELVEYRQRLFVLLECGVKGKVSHFQNVIQQNGCVSAQRSNYSLVITFGFCVILQWQQHVCCILTPQFKDLIVAIKFWPVIVLIKQFHLKRLFLPPTSKNPQISSTHYYCDALVAINKTLRDFR